jgi:steroid delta-isomerase-like uncharacterized protein
MTEAANLEVVRRSYAEAWSPLDVEALGRFYAEDYLDHNPLAPEGTGLVQLKGEAAMLKTAFPGELNLTLDLLFAHEDVVVGRWTSRGTTTGALMGMPATGKQATITGIDISRVKDGKIVEVWHQEDLFGLLQQLGLMPAAGQVPA